MQKEAYWGEKPLSVQLKKTVQSFGRIGLYRGEKCFSRFLASRACQTALLTFLSDLDGCFRVGRAFRSKCFFSFDDAQK